MVSLPRKRHKAIAGDPRIWMTTTGATVMPIAITRAVLGGGEALAAGAAGVRRTAPYLEKGADKLSKAVKRGKGFVKETSRKADIKIRTSKTGIKNKLNLEKVGEAATGLIDNQPPSPTLGGAVSVGKAIAEEGINYANTIDNLLERTSIRRSNSTNNKK